MSVDFKLSAYIFLQTENIRVFQTLANLYFLIITYFLSSRRNVFGWVVIVETVLIKLKSKLTKLGNLETLWAECCSVLNCKQMLDYCCACVIRDVYDTSHKYAVCCMGYSPSTPFIHASLEMSEYSSLAFIFKNKKLHCISVRWLAETIRYAPRSQMAVETFYYVLELCVIFIWSCP